jgi:hypothetical protein
MAKKIIFRSKVKRAAGIAKEAWESGIRSIAREVKAETQALIDTPYPPASKPLTPPHKRSGKLHGGITVVVETASRGKAAALVIKSDAPYANWVDKGTRKMVQRPFSRRVLTGSRRGTALSKKWVAKIARAARAKSKTKATRRRR